MKFGGRQKLQV